MPIYSTDESGQGQVDWNAVAYMLGGMGEAVAEDPNSWQAQMGRLAKGFADVESAKQAQKENLKRRQLFEDMYLGILRDAMGMMSRGGPESKLSLDGEGGMTLKFQASEIGQHLAGSPTASQSMFGTGGRGTGKRDITREMFEYGENYGG